MGYIFDLREKLGHDTLILTGSAVIVVNDRDEILLGKRTDNGYWDFPAGSMASRHISALKHLKRQALYWASFITSWTYPARILTMSIPMVTRSTLPGSTISVSILRVR